MAEAELQSSQAKLKERESLISEMEPANKKMRISLEDKSEQYKRQNQFDNQEIEELRSKLKFAQGEAVHAKSKIHEIECQKKIDMNKLELKILSLQEDCSSMKTEIANVKSEKAETVRKLNVEIGKLELKVGMLTDENEKHQEYVQTLQRQKNELAEKAVMGSVLEKELKEALDRIKTLENKIEADKDAAVRVKNKELELKFLAELQKENHALEEVNKNISETLMKLKTELEENITTLTRRLQQFQTSSPNQESLIKQFLTKFLFLTKETENCRNLLDSYLSESTMTGSGLSVDHINRLEDLNMEYKKALEKSEKEVNILNEKIKTLTENNQTDKLMVEVKKLQDENSSHVARIADLENEKNMLESQRSEENLEQVPVDRFSNTIKHHFKEFKKILKENDCLKKRVEVLEKQGAADSGVTLKYQQKLTEENFDTTTKTLQDQLTAAEKQQHIIVNCVRSKITEFRDGLSLLFGYRIEVPVPKQYKLTHVHADSRDDYLLFQIDSLGIRLIETEYSKRLSDKRKYYLDQHRSFPAFLASLTTYLFGKKLELAS